MIKVQKAPISFVYNLKGTNHFLVCYAPGDDMIVVFENAYKIIKDTLHTKKIEKGE